MYEGSHLYVFIILLHLLSLLTSMSYSLQAGMREDQEAEEGESEGKGRYQATGIDTIDGLSYSATSFIVCIVSTSV